MVTLFNHPLSPYGMKVHMFLEEAGRPFEYRSVTFDKKSKQWEELGVWNPFGKVPTVVDGSFSMGESNAIMRYFAQKWGMTEWYPLNLEERAHVDMWTDFVSNHIDPPLSKLAWHLTWAERYGRPSDPRVIAEAQADVARYLPALEKHLAGRHYVVGPRPTLADLALLPFISAHRDAHLDLTRWPAINAWYEHMSQRPSWARVATKISQAQG